MSPGRTGGNNRVCQFIAEHAMQDYPHRYKAAARGGTDGIIDTGSEDHIKIILRMNHRRYPQE